MTTTTQGAGSSTGSSVRAPAGGPATAGSYGSLGPSRSAVMGKARSIATWLLILVLGSVALVVLGARATPDARLLDPRSPAPIGSKAIAEVLRDNGVDVSVIESVAQLPTEVPSGTTVVVTADDGLSPSALREVARRAAGADRLVVLLAQPGAVGVLTPDLQGYPAPTAFPLDSAPASRCAIPGINPGDVVSGAGVLMLPTSDLLPTSDADIETCLPTRGMEDAGALLALLPAAPDRPQTFLVGFGPGLTNDTITSEDNAAIGLRLLGHSPDLLWLIPSGDEGPQTSGDTYSPWPVWTTPVAATLAVGTVLLALVRGRRLGRVVHEPLPVVVRAAETTESRAHLYRRSRDRARTAAILREGTRSRLRQRLGVARGEPLQTLVLAVANATGEPVDRIHALLDDNEPASTAALITLGTDLAELEGKVRLR